jgi:hypothetical protein
MDTNRTTYLRVNVIACLVFDAMHERGHYINAVELDRTIFEHISLRNI